MNTINQMNKLMMVVATACATLCMNVAQAKVAELITVFGDEFAEATTNGYDSLQAAINAMPEYSTNSASCVRLLTDRHETIRVSGKSFVRLSLNGHVLYPDSTAQNGEVFSFFNEDGSGVVEICDGRLAGNIFIGGSKFSEMPSFVLLHDVILGDVVPSDKGQIKSTGTPWFEFGIGFIGNCTIPYDIPNKSAFVVNGAYFACDQSHVNCNEDVKIKPDGEDGGYVAEEVEEVEDSEAWNSTSCWMSAMQSQLPLSRFTMISSHDAGMADGHTFGVGYGPSNCQKYSLENQMKKAGSRYFDLRPRMLGIKPSHTWYTCHGWVIGEKMSACFTDAKNFLRENPSEAVFMRISHYDNTKKFKDLIGMLLKDYDSLLFKRKDRPILNEVPLGEVRGKIIIVIEKDILKNPDFGVALDPSKGIWGCDEQGGDACMPGREGGYFYVHDDYANNDDFAKMKDFVFGRWAKQSEYIAKGKLTPEQRSFMLCWQLTMQPPFVGKGWRHYTNRYRAYVCSQHLKDDMAEGIVDKKYVRPMLVNLDYVDKDDFKIVNAYNADYRTSGGKVSIPQDVWEDMRNHPSVGFSIHYVNGDKTNEVEVVNGYRNSPYHSFDLPLASKGHEIIVRFSVPPGSKDISTGEPIASKALEFIDGGTNVVWNVEKFPVMTIEYIDHDDVGNEFVREISEAEFTPITSRTSKLQSNVKYVVAENLTLSTQLEVEGDAWLLIPDGKSLTLNKSLCVSEPNSISIYGQREGSGTLTAYGGTFESGSSYMPAIGSDSPKNSGSTIIHGGTVIAHGGQRAPGISNSCVEGPHGNVTIYGGTVIAYGGQDSAGIGGGHYYVGKGDDVCVTIHGGNVTAYGGYGAAGIGGSRHHHAGTVKIYGGKVTAQGGTSGTGIGGGDCIDEWNRGGGDPKKFCGEITIYGGEVSAIGGEGAAGIGGGSELGFFFGGGNTCCGTVTINGGKVFAQGGLNGAGIGAGHAEYTFEGSITINGGEVTAIGNNSAPGIGGPVTAVTFGPSFIGAVLAGDNAENADYMLTTDFVVNHDAIYAKMPVAALRIPYIAGVDCIVSNSSGIVAGELANGTNTYEVIPGGWMSVSFKPVAGGVMVKDPLVNPLNLGIADGITIIDRADLPIAGFPYRDYDEAVGMINTYRLASECEIVTKDTGSFSSGWYVVNDEIVNTTGGIAVSGDAHLILCDGASLTVNGSSKPGIEVTTLAAVTNSLSIYAQPSGTGALKAVGGSNCAGIGGGLGANANAGIVVVNGGIIEASGGGYGAGIGGGDEAGRGGAVTINGGKVTATGKSSMSPSGYRAGSAIGAAALASTASEVAGTVTFGRTFEGGVRAGLDADSATFKTPAEYSAAHRALYATMPELNPVEIKIPQVEGVVYVVSNAMKTIVADWVDGTNVYEVYAADAPELYFKLCPGYAYVREPSINPMTFGCVMSSMTVELVDLPTTERIPLEYLDWDNANGTLTNAVRQISEIEFVTPETKELSNGWYAVNRDIVNATDGITVIGDVHLILCDGASLTANGVGRQALSVVGDSSLTLYGQSAGTGRLVAIGDSECAGIGSGSASACGKVTINGGIVLARGGRRGSGIGGGVYGSGGTVTINAGRLLTYGGEWAKGIGAGYLGDNGQIAINGGIVVAESDERGVGIGGNGVMITDGAVSASSISGGDIAVSGGIFAQKPQKEWLALGFMVVENEDETTRDDYPWAVIHPSFVVVTVGDHPHLSAAWTSGDGTVTNAILEADFQVAWGENVKVIFEAEDDWEVGGEAVVDLGAVKVDITFGKGSGYKVPRAVKTIAYRDWDSATGTFTNAIRQCLLVTDATRTLESDWYVVKDKLVFPEGKNLTIAGDAHLILEDQASLTITNTTEHTAGIVVIDRNQLTIYGQEMGKGVLMVRGGDFGAGIGGGRERGGGTVTVNGGMVTASGGKGAAGIGGGYYGNGGTVTINGGTVTTDSEDTGAGIGGGYYGNGGVVTINGGTVTAKSVMEGAGIGGGYGGSGGRVTLNGGTVTAMGGEYGAGIGGGWRHEAGEVMINGGTVTAIAGRGAAGIGNGYNSSNPNCTVIIADGQVMAQKGGRVSSNNVEPDDIGYGESIAERTPGVRVQISGGIFTNRPKNEWCLSHYAPVANLDPETCADYPYIVRRQCIVKIGKIPPRVSIAWTGGDGSITNEVNSESFDVAPGTVNLRVIVTPKVDLPLDGEAVIDLGTLTEDITFGVGNSYRISRPYSPFGDITYVDWQGALRIESVLSKYDYLPVTETTRELENGAWYAVTNDVVFPNASNLKTLGSARIILCDGASLTITNAPSGLAAIEVDSGRTLTIYGQAGNTGTLTARGGESAAGIGGDAWSAPGKVIINGGTVTAWGGDSEGLYGGAGIGGGYDNLGSAAVEIRDGRVTAHGGGQAEDIGLGESSQAKRAVSIYGGAFWIKPEDGWLATDCVVVENPDEATRVDYPWAVVPQWCVVTIGNHPHMTAMWTSDDEAEMKVIDGTYFKVGWRTENVKVIFMADPGWELVGENVVNLGLVTSSITFGIGNNYQVPFVRDPSKDIEYLDWDALSGTMTNAVVWAEHCTAMTSDMRTLTSGWYVVTNQVVFPQDVNLTVSGDVHLILCDEAELSIMTLNGGAAIDVSVREGVRNSLTIYGQNGGTGKLQAKAFGAGGAGIGGGRECDGGVVTINGGMVTAQGGACSAGIGCGYPSSTNCTVMVNGGTVTATGGVFAAGIGGGYKQPWTGSVTITGGRVTAIGNGNASAIGHGEDGTGDSSDIAISGGIFSWKPNDAWLVPGCESVGNTDESTREAYPWMVVWNGPICEGGTIGFVNGVWVVTPNTDAKAVTITGLLEGAKLAVKLNGYNVPSEAFMGWGEGGVFSLALNPEVVTPKIGELDEGEPFVVGAGEVAITIKTIPGLKYSLVRGAELGKIDTTVVTTPAISTETTLKDSTLLTGNAFYRVGVER